MGFGYSSITKACAVAYTGAQFEPDGWAMYLKPAPKHDTTEMLNLAKREIPELKSKAYTAHHTRNVDGYAEKDAKEKEYKAKIQAEKDQKALAEKTDKEIAKKKGEEERLVKEQDKVAAAAVAAAKARN